jgi:NAD-dependent dihydropyrimidine dehydrogenase PreA subunit
MKYRYIMPGTSLELESAACVGCLRCVDVCPHAVFAPAKKKVVVAQRDQCMECGACALNCPQKAIKVESGVGCAAAVIGSIMRGKGSEAGTSCGCGNGGKDVCC